MISKAIVTKLSRALVSSVDDVKEENMVNTPGYSDDKMQEGAE